MTDTQKDTATYTAGSNAVSKLATEDANPYYQARIKKERRIAFVEAAVVNAALFGYFAFACYMIFEQIRAHFSETELNAQYDGNFMVRLAALGAVVGVAVTLFSRSPGRILIERTNKILKPLYVPSTRPFYLSPSGLFGLAVGAVTVVLGWMITEIRLQDFFFSQGSEHAAKLASAMLMPNTGILPQVLFAMLDTIFMALMSTTVALPFAFFVSFLCARNLMKHHWYTKAIYFVLRFVFNFSRSVEPILWAIVFSVWIGIGPFAGMMALMIHSVASLAKQYSEVIEDIDYGPMEAIEATGANPVQVVAYGVVPQIVLPFLSFTIFRWDINIRMATVIGLVGGGGIGTLLFQYQGHADWQSVGTIIIAIALVVWIMDYLTARIREAIY